MSSIHAAGLSRRAGVLMVLAAPSMAWAAEAGGDGDGPSVTDWNIITFISTVLVFGAAFFILQKFAWPKIIGALDEREAKIRAEINAAEEARERADAALKEYEASLAKARAEANEMIERTKAEQARLAADLKQQAEAEVGAMKDSAMRGIDAARKAAINELYREAASLSTAAAARILQREVNEHDQAEVVRRTIEEYAARA